MKQVIADVEIEISPILSTYKLQIDSLIKKNVSTFGQNSRLREACEYALLNGGKRFRPALVLMVAEGLGKYSVAQSALAVEYFHTASLIADDLPCMDDDNERRNCPSLHKAFDESTALLASYALIAAGYGCIAKNVQEMKQQGMADHRCDRICVLALENASHNTGVFGATGGQFLDLFPPNRELSTLRSIIHKKTISLFEISFVLGWLFGGGDIEMIDLVKGAASHFGMAFQIADDFEDVEQDIHHQNAVNIVIALGEDVAKELFQQELTAFSSSLKKLNLKSLPLESIANTLSQSIL